MVGHCMPKLKPSLQNNDVPGSGDEMVFVGYELHRSSVHTRIVGDAIADILLCVAKQQRSVTALRSSAVIDFGT